MKFKNVVIQSLTAIDPPIRVTSMEIEKQLKTTFDRLGIRSNLLEEVSGIGARRFWEEWNPAFRRSHAGRGKSVWMMQELTAEKSGSSSIPRSAVITWSPPLPVSCTVTWGCRRELPEFRCR